MKKHDAVVVSNLQGFLRTHGICLPECACLLPVCVTTQAGNLIPDIPEWLKYRPFLEFGARESPIPHKMGSRVAFVCGQSPLAIQNGEDCSYFRTASILFTLNN